MSSWPEAPPLGWQGDWPPQQDGTPEPGGMAWTTEYGPESAVGGFGSIKVTTSEFEQQYDKKASPTAPQDFAFDWTQHFGGNQSPVRTPKVETETESDWSVAFSISDRAKSSDDADVLSAIEYDPTGKFVASGTKGGKISIYARKEDAKVHTLEPLYALNAEFQSHNAEFDYLKSLEIEEKINQIKWCRPSSGSQCLLSTNDKTIKLWKVHERTVREVTTFNEQGLAHVPHQQITPELIRLPSCNVRGQVTATTAKRVYANAHTYHINSIAINSDGETFMSADDLRVNLWSLGISNQSFNIVDIKPANMEELTEVITAADFHPTHCNVMMYSTSRGAIKLGDMRQGARCDSHSQVFEELEDPEARSFFSEIIASISDIKFSPDGRYIIARDYLTLKVWDINMNSQPVMVINVHEDLRQRLGDLYESDCIFDKFECSVSGDGNNFVTGSYNSTFHIYDRYGSMDVSLTPRPPQPRTGRRHSTPHADLAQQLGAMAAAAKADKSDDFGKKVLHASWHPSAKEVAVAIRNGLFVYSV